MKKTLKIFLSAILCAVFCVSICACSCAGISDNGEKDNSSTYPIGDDVAEDIF